MPILTNIMAKAEVESSPKRLSLREAVATASAYLQEAYSGERLKNTALEEVWETEGGRYWFVTLGFDTKRDIVADPPPFQALTHPFLPGTEVKRDFKTFKVDAEKGKVLSMKVYRPSS